MRSLQTFFDNSPALAGIIVFIIISVVVIATALILLFVQRSKKKLKRVQEIQEEASTQDVTKLEEEVIEIDNSIYVILDFDNSGNLILKNLENGEINSNPRKKDFLDVINQEGYRLALPEDKVWISLDENGKFTTSKEAKDKNLFVFNQFLKFMNTLDMPWAISKFV